MLTPTTNTTLPVRRVSAAAAAMAQVAIGSNGSDDLFTGLLNEARSRIRQQMQPAQIEDPTDDDLRTAEGLLTPLVDSFLASARRDGLTVSYEPDRLLRQIMDEIFGFGPLAPYLAEEQVEEIICNGPADIWIIHAERGKEKTTAQFRTAREMINFVNRVARTGGRRIDKSNPKIDARMRDGSRLHAIMEPLTVNVPIALTIRRHRLIARTIDDLMRLGTITPSAGEFLRLAVEGRLNIVVAGGTASGKSNFVNALGNAVGDGERILIVEDTPELQIQKADIVQMCTRDKAEEARSFTIADLVIEALRMRPDRIITGEARGPEIIDVLTAANTGHDGQLLTIHANSTRDVIQRMETMYLMRGADVPLFAIRRQIADAFQLVIFLKRVFVGNRPRRFVTEIAEISPSQFMEGDKVVVQNLFEDKGNGLNWTGYFPDRLAHRMSENGVTLRPNFFRA
jgi:pilus assembly protein CpaF